MPEFDVRRATPDDTDAVRALLLPAFEAYGNGLNAPRAQRLLGIQDQVAAGLAWMYYENNDLVAVAIDDEISDPTTLPLHVLGVRLDLQSKGYGPRVMRHYEQHARERGFVKITLYTAEIFDHLIRFYTRMGYTELSRSPHETKDDGFLRVFFEKTI